MYRFTEVHFSWPIQEMSQCHKSTKFNTKSGSFSTKLKPYMYRNGDQRPICLKYGLTVNKRVMVEAFYKLLIFGKTWQLYIVTPITYARDAF